MSFFSICLRGLLSRSGNFSTGRLLGLSAFVALIAAGSQAWAQSAATAETSERGATATADQAEEAATAQAESDELGKQWVRIAQNNEGEPTALQVAIVTYRGKASDRDVIVDLVGAVHVGDTGYYEQLNKRFVRYDALLYELVAPEGTIVTAEDKAAERGPVGAIQGGMKSMLDLEHQLEKIDYTRPNFVHADMSPEEFFQSMEDRGEGVLQIFFRMMGQGIAVQSKQAAKGESTDLDLMRAMFAPDRARQLKIVFAKQMAELESTLLAFGGENGSTLITERNKAALEVLRRELDAGKSHLGVFYGAGHLTDMDQRLQKDFGLLPEGITWLNAWDLTAK